MAQNITLLGASYTAVPAVTLPKTGGGSAKFSDASVTTAVPSDVAEGKIFLLADGTPATGEASGGGGSGYTRTVVCPQQTVTPTSDGTYYGATLNVSEGFEADAEYIITYNGTEYFFTCQVLWGTNYLLGEINYFYGGSDFPYPFGIIWVSGTTCTIARDNGNQVTVKIEKLELTGSGGGGSATLITKTITQNGTYDAEDDSADGYSSVTVNVAGGASNIVTGTFKGTTTGAAMDVDLAYTGNGYPIAVMIYPEEGVAKSNGSYYPTLQRYAYDYYAIIKNDATSTPTYNGGTNDSVTGTVRLKNSSSNATSFSQNTVSNSYDDVSASASANNAVKVRSNKKMSVFIAAANHGFMANVDYRYVIYYSS